MENGLIIEFESILSIEMFIDDPLSKPIINSKFYKSVDDFFETDIHKHFVLSKTEENKPFNSCYKHAANEFPLD